MKRKKKYYIYLMSCSLFILAFLVSCRGNQGNTTNSMTKNTQTEESTSASEKSIKMNVTEQLTVDISNFDMYDLQQEKIQVKSASIDLKAIKGLVFPEDESSETLDSPYDGVERFTTEEGVLIIHDGLTLVGYSKGWELYNDFLGLRTAEDIAVHTPTDEELDFMSKEDVKKQILDIAKSIGIGFEPTEVKIEAYTHEYFTALIDNIKNNPNYAEYLKKETLEREWSKTDELYSIQIGFEQQGIPIDEEGYSLLDESSIMGMQLQLYLTDQGIQFFSVNALVDRVKTIEVDICNVQEGLDSIASKYKNIVTDDKTKIVGVRLEYNLLPEGMNGDLYLTPVLRFDMETISKMNSTKDSQIENVTFQDVIRVNAVTRRIVE